METTMMTTENIWKHIILRTIIISGVGIFVGFLFYGNLVFTPTMKASQFSVSSITAGLAYAFLKSSMPRNLLAALFIYYVILNGLLVEFNWWLPILNLAYISGITAAIFIYNHLVSKPYSKNSILRIIFAGAITSVANGVIIIFLGMFSSKVVVAHFTIWMDAVKFNLEIGAIIGLAVGIGIELAEYFDSALIEYESEIVSENELMDNADKK